MIQATPSDARGDRDWIIAAVALGCLVISSALLAWDPRHAQAPAVESKVVGTVSFSSADLRRRPASRLGWDEVGRGGVVHELDALFVPPGVEAKVAFLDGTVLELDERSLVVIDLSHAGRRNVSVRQGSVEGRAGPAGLLLSTPQGTAQLSAQSQAIIEVTGDAVAMAVTKGDGLLGSTALASGERGDMSASGTQAQGTWPVSLLEPARNQRRFFRSQAPPLEFRWQKVAGEARLQLARDRGFAFVLEEHSASEGSFVFNRGGAGVFWWRIVNEAGQPVSESRRITVLEDVPPTLLSPRDGELVLSSDKQMGVFSWVGVRGVSSYKLEVAPVESFESISWGRQVEGGQLRTPLSLDEGRWFWRVRTLDEERGESGPSRPQSFRLIHRALPEAPELLNPEIEVEPARGK